MYKSTVKLSADGDKLFSEGDVIPGTFFEVDIRAKVNNINTTANTLVKLQVWAARGDPLTMTKIKEWEIKRSDFVDVNVYKVMCMRNITLNLTDRNFQVRLADYNYNEAELYIDWIAAMPMVRPCSFTPSNGMNGASRSARRSTRGRSVSVPARVPPNPK